MFFRSIFFLSKSLKHVFLPRAFLNFIVLALFTGMTLMGVSKVAHSEPLPLNETSKTTSQKQAPITFGILVPLEHAALKEIVEGFITTVKQHYPNAVFDIENAQGDIKLQRAIIENFAGNEVDIIVPIGTTAAQMTLAVIKRQPIVSLAADYPESERQKQKPIHMTGVLDEIGGKKKLDFIKQVMPELKKLTIIFHSGNEKNFSEIQALIEYGKTLNVQVQKLSINTFTPTSSNTSRFMAAKGNSFLSTSPPIVHQPSIYV